MVVASLVLILVAAVLLVVGLVRDSDVLLIVSIAVSLVAAVALYLGARRGGGRSPSDEDEDTDAGPDTDTEDRAAGRPARSGRDGDRPTERLSGVAGARRGLNRTPPEWPLGDREPARRRTEPALANGMGNGAGNGAADGAADGAALGEGESPTAPSGVAEPDTAADDPMADPADEPPSQYTPREDAELIARLPAEVQVVDGRPRYHLLTCRHLTGRESEPLAVSEAVELGFTPCAWCQPDTVLLGGTPKD